MIAKRLPQSGAAQEDEAPGTALQRAFGENFRAARLAAGLSQQEVSDRSGVDRVEISKIERGMVNLTLRTMDRLAKVVDHDAVHLLQDAPKPGSTRQR